VDSHQLQTVSGLRVRLSEKRIHLFPEPGEIGEIGSLLKSFEQVKIRRGIFESGLILNASGSAETEPYVLYAIAQRAPSALSDRSFQHRQDALDSRNAIFTNLQRLAVQ
jgi:hypothetical protein